MHRFKSLVVAAVMMGIGAPVFAAENQTNLGHSRPHAAAMKKQKKEHKEEEKKDDQKNEKTPPSPEPAPAPSPEQPH